uniref:Uncharacterized protein n=1 Tax=Romanomermis culicivorax TaxID=13658 RepID=A0A915JBP5_ROMCU
MTSITIACPNDHHNTLSFKSSALFRPPDSQALFFVVRQFKSQFDRFHDRNREHKLCMNKQHNKKSARGIRQKLATRVSGHTGEAALCLQCWDELTTVCPSGDTSTQNFSDQNYEDPYD